MGFAGRNSWFLWIGLAVVALIYFLIFPPFRIVSLKAAREQSHGMAFDASSFVEHFWSEQLTPAADRAIDAAVLLEALRQDPKEAAGKYSRSAGLGNARFYFVKGEGRVIKIDNAGLALAIRPETSTPEMVLQTGNIFGNAVRDGSGLLNASDFASSLDFNAISSEINHRIEQRVLPELRSKATIGSNVFFVGCAQTSGDAADYPVLELVPISAVVQ
jgi:predicted lipoprotein